MIEPTVGRVVWYWEHGKTMKDAGEQPRAAMIAYVHSNRCVNISFLTCNGEQAARTSVVLVQDGDPLPDYDFCEWIPYQKGQAAKTEQMEARLTAQSS